MNTSLFYFLVIFGLCSLFFGIPLAYLYQSSKAHVSSSFSNSSDSEKEGNYWRTESQNELNRAKEYFKHPNVNVAKNIIIFIGDGMSLPTVAATRIFSTGNENGFLSFEKFPHMALAKVYAVDARSPDSASTATAILCGVKTNYDCVGLDGNCIRGQYSSGNEVSSIMTWAQESGKDTGFVTTSRVSHGTPAALYAHSAHRKWECDSFLPKPNKGKRDISWQLVHQNPGRRAKVILGGGKVTWAPGVNVTTSFNCTREKGNLIEDWKSKFDEFNSSFKNGVVVETKEQLLKIQIESTDYLLGLFAPSHLDYRSEENKDQPTLSEMTSTAIKILQKNSKGFFLLVEGARIDMAHHDGKANKALLETMSLDEAVKTTLSMVNLENTLIIVTADHGHNMNFGAYELRGTDVRGAGNTMRGTDNKSLSILSYAHSPGFTDHFTPDTNSDNRRREIRQMPFTSPEYRAPSGAPSSEAIHSSADVSIYATGPHAHLFHSLHEQSYIASVMAYSACLEHSSFSYSQEPHCSYKFTTSASFGFLSFLILLLILFLFLSLSYKLYFLFFFLY